MQKYIKPKSIENAVYIISFAILSFVFLPLIFNLQPGLNGLLIFILCAGFYALVVASLLAVLRGRTSAKLIIALRAIAVIIAIAATILAFGLIQDNFGSRCTGFFGSRESCVQSAQFTIYLLLFNPFVLIPAMLVLSFMLVRGLQEANPTSTNKRRT